MKENMKFYFNDYQYRRNILEKIILIMDKQSQTKSNEVLFFGDSLIEGIPSGHSFINNGIGGITSQALLNNIDEIVIKFNPKSVYLHVGANDLNDTTMASPRDIALNVLKIFSILKENLPNANLYIFSTLPCVEDLDAIYSSGRGIRRNFMHDILNEEYKRYLTPLGVQYADMNQFLFDDEGIIKRELFEDGLHLTDEGYRHLIASYIEKYKTL